MRATGKFFGEKIKGKSTKNEPRGKCSGLTWWGLALVSPATGRRSGNRPRGAVGGDPGRLGAELGPAAPRQAASRPAAVPRGRGLTCVSPSTSRFSIGNGVCEIEKV